MIYDLNKNIIENKKLLKELSLIIRSFIKILFILIVLTSKTFLEKSLKKFKKILNINNFIL